MRIRSKIYTEEQFVDAVKSSYSMASVLRKIGVRPTGGNYDVARRRIKTLNLDSSHFTGSGHLKGKTHNWAKKTPLGDILINGFNGGIGTNNLKLRLFKEGLLQKKCYRCGISDWLGERLSLELEHKNGNRYDNRIENLEILCPNCHSLTSTYRGRGKNKSCKKDVVRKKERKLIDIDISDAELVKLISKRSTVEVGKIFNVSPRTVRRICFSRNIKIPHKSHLTRRFNVSKEELEKLIRDNPMTTIGKIFGVSSASIKKRAILYGILKKNDIKISDVTERN
jgi:hypothetical protein